MTRLIDTRSHLVAGFAVGLLASLGSTTAHAADNWERLRQMPREQRVQLDKKLQEFDALDRAQQASIRSLDDALAGLPESEQANQYAVMRRYHLWVQTLTEAQKAELNAAPITNRMKVAAKIMAEQRATHVPKPLFFQLADFGSASPYQVATWIKVWLKLSASQKAEVSKLQEEPRKRRMNELVRSMKIVPVPEPELTDERKKAILDRVAKNAPVLDALIKRGEDEKKKAVRTRQVLETYYLLDHPAEKVSVEALVKFDAALPPWIRTTFDSLAPDEARRRLSILYRMVFPAPLEIDPPKPATKKESKASAGTPPTGQASPPKTAPPASGKSATSKPAGPF